MALNIGALGAGVAAAAPGIKQGIDAMNAPRPGLSAAQQDSMDASLQAANSTSDADNATLQAALHPMADPSHPVWPVLSAAAGAPQQGVPTQSTPPGLSKGGVMPVSKMPPKGPLPANFGGAKNYQNGGPVRGANYGSLVKRPEFTRGPAIPATDANGIRSADLGGVHGRTGYETGGPVDGSGRGGSLGLGQGITPASTEGQVLTMDEGGAVPTSQANFMQPPAMSQPPVTGRAAGFASGLQSGVALGHNLEEQWHQNEARRALYAQQGTEGQVAEKEYRLANPGMAPMEDENIGGPMDRLHSVINNFASILGFHSHDENGSQPDPRLVSKGTNTSTTGALPAPSPAAAPPGGPASPGPSPPGSPAPGGAAPVPGPPGATGAPAAAPAPAAPGAGPAGSPSTPPAAAAAKGQAAAASTGAGPQQSAATGAAVASTTAALAKPPQRSADNQTPGGAYSMDPHDQIIMERAKTRAAQAAALAGLDPTRVYSALSAQQTAHFQGQYLMQIGRAQQAMQLGHYDDMEKYLKNAGYYLPNGQDVEFKKASDLSDADRAKLGPDIDSNTRLVTNPFFGMAGHQGESQYVPLNPITLGSFAQAAMDPRAFAQGQMEMLKAGREYQVNMLKAQASMGVGQGRLLLGQAAYGKMLDDQAKTPANLADTRAQADLRESQAAYWRSKGQGTGGSAVKIKPSDVEKAQQDAGKAFDDSRQGQLETASPYMLDAKGQPQKDPATGQPIPNPHGNQPYRNPQHISPLYQSLSPQEANEGRGLAGELHSANMNMTPQESADLAARIVQQMRPSANGQPQTHINPKSGKPEKNVVTYQAKGHDGQMYPAVRVWADGHYIIAWATPNVDTSGGETPAQGIESGGGTGSASEGGNEPEDQTESDVLAGK